jgi:hypothetical protein
LFNYLAYAQASSDETAAHLNFIKDNHGLSDADVLLNLIYGVRQQDKQIHPICRKGVEDGQN